MSEEKNKQEEFINPIDKDKVAENPGLLPYAHHSSSAIIRPEDKGKIKGRAIMAMEEQTITISDDGGRIQRPRYAARCTRDIR